MFYAMRVTQEVQCLDSYSIKLDTLIQVAPSPFLHPDCPGPDPGQEPLHSLPRAQHRVPGGRRHLCDQGDHEAHGERQEGGTGHSQLWAADHWLSGGAAARG